MSKIKTKLFFDENRTNKISLFLLESVMMQGYRPIDDAFTSQVNDFIFRYYDDNKELFDCFLCERIVKLYIQEDKELLSLDEMIDLMVKCRGFNGYLALVDSISQEDLSKINDLALLFTKYYEEMLRLYEETLQPGYVKILH